MPKKDVFRAAFSNHRELDEGAACGEVKVESNKVKHIKIKLAK